MFQFNLILLPSNSVGITAENTHIFQSPEALTIRNQMLAFGSFDYVGITAEQSTKPSQFTVMTGIVRQFIGHKDRKQADRGQIFRKTDEQTLGETDRQADKKWQDDGQAYVQTDGQADELTDGQAVYMTDGNADGLVDGQTVEKTDKQEQIDKGKAIHRKTYSDSQTCRVSLLPLRWEDESGL